VRLLAMQSVMVLWGGIAGLAATAARWRGWNAYRDAGGFPLGLGLKKTLQVVDKLACSVRQFVNQAASLLGHKESPVGCIPKRTHR